MVSHDVTSRRSSSEKHAEKHSEVQPDAELVPTTVDRNAGLDDKAVKRAMLKLDLVVLPVVVSFYLLSFIDRANIGNARVAGFQRDLGITNNEYSTALTVTYVPYILAELPSNLLLKRVGANILLPLLVVAWGIVSMCQIRRAETAIDRAADISQAFVTNYSGLLAARFFLGLTEGGLLPGLVLFLSTFYPRNRLQVRVAFLFCATSLSGAFSGLLAAAIQQIQTPILGHVGWPWIFLLEGLFTILFGLVSFFFMPRSPAACRFLNATDKHHIEQLLLADGGGETRDDHFRWSDVRSAFTSPNVLLMAISFFCSGTTLFGLAVFLPSVVGSLGYSATRTQLLSVPQYACAAVLSLIVAFAGDRMRMRGVWVLLATLIGVSGYGIYLGTTDRNTLSNNVSPQTKRATALAISFTFTNCGGILSTWLFPATEAPRFRTGTIVNLSLDCVQFASASATILYLWSQNKKKDRKLATMSAEEKDAVINDRTRTRPDTDPTFKCAR